MTLPVTEFMNTRFEESNVDAIGLSDSIRPWAIDQKITFEAARNDFYQAFDAQELELTNLYKVKLGSNK